MFLARSKRSASARQESECYEERCSYEELREIFKTPAAIKREWDKLYGKCICTIVVLKLTVNL